MSLPVRLPGLAFICSMCEHMGEASEKGFEDCGVSCCGGLSMGRAFPLYKGPLALAILDYCHRCGVESTQVLEVDNSGRVGICNECLKNLLDNEDLHQ